MLHSEFMSIILIKDVHVKSVSSIILISNMAFQEN